MLFERAFAAGVRFIFTMNSARGIDPIESTERSMERITAAANKYGARVVGVHLEPSLEVLEQRIANPSRANHGKLLDVVRLRERMKGWDSKPLDPSHLSIDNSSIEPIDAAKMICEHFRLPY